MKVIKGLTWKNPRGELPLLASACEWQTRRPDVRIEWEALSWYAFENALLAALENPGPDYDLVMFDHPWTGSLACSGGMLPWDSLMTQEELVGIRGRIVPPSFDSYVWDGKVWGLALDGACHAGLIRKDLAEIDSVPSHWEDIAAWAESVRCESLPYPLVLSVEGVLGSCLFLSMMASGGHAVTVVDSALCLDSTATLQVLRLLRSLLAYVPPGSTHWGPWDIYEYFCRSDESAYSPSIFAYVNYFHAEGRGAQLRLLETPGLNGRRGTPILGGVGLGIMKKCSLLEEAVEYARYLISDAAQTRLFPENSGQPTAKAAWECAVLDRQYHGFYSSLSREMEHAYMRPRVPGFHFIELEIGRSLQPYWDGEATEESILAQLRAIRGECHV